MLVAVWPVETLDGKGWAGTTERQIPIASQAFGTVNPHSRLASMFGPKMVGGDLTERLYEDMYRDRSADGPRFFQAATFEDTLKDPRLAFQLGGLKLPS